jgi:hypothetical protein
MISYKFFHKCLPSKEPSKQKSEYEDEFIKVSDIVDMAQTIKR